MVNCTESETFEFPNKEKGTMFVQGIIDGKFQTIETARLPCGYIRDLDFVSRVEDFKNVTKTDLKVKYHGQEYKVFEFTELEPKFIGRKSVALEKLGIPTFETDIPYKRRIYVDKVFNVSYKNRIAFLDFEMDDELGFRDYGEMPFKASTIGIGKTLKYTHVSDFDTEKEFVSDIMLTLRKWLKTVLVGFNVMFDYKHLRARAQSLGLSTSWLNYCYPFDIREFYMDEVKGLSTYSLEEIASYEKIGVKHREKRICDMSRSELEDYNKNDVALLLALEDKYGFVSTQVRLQENIGLPLSMHSAYLRGDTLVLRRLHELGYVAINAEKRKKNPYEGGYVKEPITGLHKDIAVVDGKSLYPNVLIERKIDIDGWNGEVIPYLAKFFMGEKDRCGKIGDEVGKNANKVCANMLYGLFGYLNFRYYERVKAEATAKGARDVLYKVMDILDMMAQETIYGDTDSDFFRANGITKEQLNAIVEYINAKLNPYEVKLEHRFEQLIMYRKNSGEPAKKRYVGFEDGKLFARGVELRRGDWCAIAKENLRDSIMAVFSGESSDDVLARLNAIKHKLFNGELNDKLIIRKSLKEDKKYKVKTPQMTAFTKGIKKGIYTGKEVEVSYYFDSKGEPEPWTDKEKSFDYSAYYERQIKPPIDRLLMSIRVEKGKQTRLA